MSLQYYSTAVTLTSILPSYISYSVAVPLKITLFSTSVSDAGKNKFQIKLLDLQPLFSTIDLDIEFLNTAPYFT